MEEALTVISSELKECDGHKPFLETLFEAVDFTSSDALQLSALSSLSSLLKLETYHHNQLSEEKFTKLSENVSMQSVFDYIPTPRASRCEVNAKESLGKENEVPNEENQECKDKKLKSENQKRENKIRNNEQQDCKEATVKPRIFLPGNSDINSFKNAYLSNVHITNFENTFRKKRLSTGRTNEEPPLMAGAELCKILLNLFNINSIQTNGKKSNLKKKFLILNSLSGLLCVSKEAKGYALREGLLEIVIKQLQHIHMKLSLESVDCLRRVADRKRINPLLQELNSYIGLMTNFLLRCLDVKRAAAAFGLADVCHKLWGWVLAQKMLVVDVLKMLCTFTANCNSGR